MEEFKEFSTEVFETQKINDQIETLQKQKKDALEELGNIVYENSSQGLFDEENIKKKCEAIGEIDNQIKEREDKLLQIFEKVKESIFKLKVIAPCDCGAELYEGVRFCYRCGREVEKIEKAEEKTKRTEEKAVPDNVTNECPQCGAQLSLEAKFCSECGLAAKSLV
ncbi:MAG TPA: zinc-ribbon domain-containing protein [Thermodesulfovibrionales bacterium]|nr:zinc-ribbon domain-containing protein [Thermodesulfovibrionales bacterium]